MSQKLKDIFVDYTRALKIFDIEHAGTYWSTTFKSDVTSGKSGKTKRDVPQFSITRSLMSLANPEDGVVFELKIVERLHNNKVISSGLKLSMKGAFDEAAFRRGETEATVEECVIKGVVQDVSKPVDIAPLYKKLAFLHYKADINDMHTSASGSGTAFKSVMNEHQIYTKFKKQLKA